MSSQSFIYRRSRDLAQTRPEPEQYCKIKKQCQSCAFINDAYEGSLETKYQAGLAILKQSGTLEGASILKVQASPRKYQYRSHAKLAVRRLHKNEPDATRFGIGLFEPGSHDLVDLTACPVHAEGINELVLALRGAFNESTLQPYDEESHSGDVRYIAIRRAHLTGAMMLTFVVTKDLKRELKDVVQKLRRLNHKLASVHMNINADPGNAIFSDDTQVLFGAAKLRESVCDLTFEISPTAFFQVNPWTAEEAYRRIEQLVGGVNTAQSHTAWDFFCGVGQISMILARQGYQTLGIEVNEEAVRNAKHNARLNELTSQLTFISGRTEDVQHAIPEDLAAPELIVVNPSRKGIPVETIDFIAKALKNRANTRLIYMSCDVSTLSRDLSLFSKEYGLRLRQVEAFDMFPYTDNMEWLAVITP